MCLSCSSADRPGPVEDGEPQRPDRAPPVSSAFQTRKCFVEPPRGHAADCGFVSGQGVELAVMVIYSNADAPVDPVVYLEGGPGASAIELARYEPFVFSHILAQRDLVLIDQRGTGHSIPSLQCLNNLEPSFEAELELLAGCRNEWAGRGVELADFNTRENARDIDRVRQALGYASWNLYGISYGSRLALTVARDFPEGVRALALDGVLPPQVDLLAGGLPSIAGSLEAVAEACHEQSACSDAYGDIATKLFELVDRLESEPVELQLDAGGSLTLNGRLAFAVFVQLLYVSDVLPYLPAAIVAVHEEDYSLFEALLSSGALGTGLAAGMYYSVTCQDEAAFTSSEQIEDARAHLDPRDLLAFDATALLQVCDVWDVPDSPESENERVESDIFSLVTSGAFDPVTPAAYGEAAASGLENSQHFVLADQSHGASLGSCGQRLLLRFLDDPEAMLPHDCVDALGPPAFEARRQPLSIQPRLQFEVPVSWDDALRLRLVDAVKRGQRLFPAPALPGPLSR